MDKRLFFIQVQQQKHLYCSTILEWDSFYNNSIHLYGHVHHNKKEYFRNILGPSVINVGVDVNNFSPISLEQVLTMVNSREK